MRGGAPPAALTEAGRADDFADARMLFREYAAELGVDLCFQGFEAELDRLPDLYWRPRGVPLVRARRVIGRRMRCAAPPRRGEVCEMKRLYVRAEARGTGLGRILAERLIATGRSLGYAQHAARYARAHEPPLRQLYRSLGFAEIAPYYDNPLANVVYMELDLSAVTDCAQPSRGQPAAQARPAAAHLRGSLAQSPGRPASRCPQCALAPRPRHSTSRRPPT